MTTATKKSIAEQHPNTAVLISEISRLQRGDTVTFEQFGKWLGKPIYRLSDVPNLQTVRTRLRTDYGLLLSPIIGIGCKILTNEQAALDNSRLTKAARQAKLMKKEKATVDLGQLKPDQVQKVVGMLTIANVVEASAKDKTVERITAAINGATQPLALGHALDRLKENL